ncbi:UNVERIFIED_CONTAM: hypothetical protein FKN15_048245 [Acipenser sinensis]
MSGPVLILRLQRDLVELAVRKRLHVYRVLVFKAHRVPIYKLSSLTAGTLKRWRI